MATSLPEMARMLALWAADRLQLNHVYGELQQMFKTTIRGNHVDGPLYNQNILNFDENQQLAHYTNKIQDLILNRNATQQIVDQLLASIDESEVILNQWITGKDAQVLWEWPN